MLWRSGGQPLSFLPLDPEDKRRGMDAYARLLLERANRSEMKALSDGFLCLQDLEIDGEAVAVISAAIGRSIDIRGDHRRTLLQG